MAQRNMYIRADEDGNFDPDELMDAVETLLTVLTFVGGQAGLGVDRVEVEPGRFQPRGLYVSYNTFVPARHLEDPVVKAELESIVDDPGEEEGEDTVAEAVPVSIES